MGPVTNSGDHLDATITAADLNVQFLARVEDKNEQ